MTYEDWRKFEEYVRYDDIDWPIYTHDPDCYFDDELDAWEDEEYGIY